MDNKTTLENAAPNNLGDTEILAKKNVFTANIDKENILSAARIDNNLEITLKNGEKIVVEDYFVENSGKEFGIETSNGDKFLLKFSDINEQGVIGKIDYLGVNELWEPLSDENGVIPIWTWIAGIGFGGAIAAAAGGGGSSSGGSSGGNGADTTAPNAPSNVIVSEGGQIISGQGETGTKVTITDKDGNIIGTGTVGPDGKFEVTLDPALTNGEEITVGLEDAAGNKSPEVAVTAPDTTAPDEPTDVAISDDGMTVTGEGEAGTKVTITDKDGNIVGTGTVDADGKFEVTLDPALTNGEEITVGLEDAAGNKSPEVTVTAPDTTAPDAPTEVVIGNGDDYITANEIVEGKVEVSIGLPANAKAGDSVIVNGDSTVLTTADIDLGQITVQVEAPAEGATLTVEAIIKDAAGNESGSKTAEATVDAVPPVQLGATFNDTGISNDDGITNDGTVTVSGVEEEALVEYSTDGGVTWKTAVLDDLSEFTLPEGIYSDVQVRQTDLAGNVGLVTNLGPITVDLSAPNTPEATVNAEGTEVTGRAEPGSTIEVTDKNGNVIGMVGTADENGSFTVELKRPVTDGEKANVTATDAAGNISNPTEIVGGEDTLAPDKPTNVVINAEGTEVTGRAELGSTVKVTDKNGNVIGTGTAAENGDFTVELERPVTDGEVVGVTATDAAGNISNPTEIMGTKDTIAPEAPTEVVINADGTEVTGRAEPGSTIEVTDKNGNVIGTGTVAENGSFTVELERPVTDGEVVGVTATDAAGNTSTSSEVVGTKDTIAPDAPEATVNAEGTEVIGRAEPGSTVKITDKNGNVIGTGVANEFGDFIISISPALTDAEKANVTATDAAGNISNPTEIMGTKDTIAPEAPIVSIDIDNVVLTVKTEPNALVKVYDSKGDVIAQGPANAEGIFTHSFDPALQKGKILEVTAEDTAGNLSDKTTLIIGVAEIIATADNDIDLILNATPKETVNTKPSDLNKTGFTLAKVGLGAVLDVGILSDVLKNSVQLTVGQDQVRDITIKGISGGVQVGGTMDLYVYKLNATSGAWELQHVTENWVIAALLGGSSKNTNLSLSEGQWMFVMGSGEGLQLLTGYTLQFSKDIVLDYANATAVSGSANGNMILDADKKHGQDELPQGTKLTQVQDGEGHWITIAQNTETIIEGHFGTLIVSANGSYTYTVNEDFRGYGEKDVFKYQVTSPSGQTAEADLSFELNLTAKEDRIVIDNIVVIDTEPKIILDTNKSEIKEAIGFSVLNLGLLGPILSADVLSGTKTMDFKVGEHQLRELTLHGSAGGVVLGVTYEMYIYKLDPVTGNYVQVHHEPNWFSAILLGGRSNDLKLQFGEGEYKAILQSKGGLGLLTGAGLYVDHDKIYDYDQPTKFVGQVKADATAEDSTILLKVKAEGVEKAVEPSKNTEITGKYGVLTIDSDGNYTYSVTKPVNAAIDLKPPYGQVDSFQLVTQDSKGKTIIEHLNIKIGLHTALSDENIVRNDQTNIIDKLNYTNSNSNSGLGDTKVNKSEKFSIAADSITTNAKITFEGKGASFNSVNTIGYKLYKLNVDGTEKLIFSKTATDGKAGLIGSQGKPSIQDDLTLESGNYRLDYTVNSATPANLVKWELKLEAITTHLKDFGETIQIVTGKLFENDAGIDNIDTLKISNKQLSVNDVHKGSASFDVVGEFGTLTVLKDGSYTYTPKGGVYGVDKFIYETTSKVGITESAVLEINVGKTVIASEHTDTILSSAGNDLFTTGAAADTVIFSLLSDNHTGGNGTDTWTDFHVGNVATDLEADKVDIRGLLDGDANLGNIQQYLSLTYDAVKQEAVISIDRDGGKNLYDPTELLILTNQNQSITIDELLQNQQIMF